jgi:arsenate reductase
MNMYKIYHNPRCAKSRAGLQAITDTGSAFEIIDYLKQPLTIDQFKRLLIKLNLPPVELVRKQEEVFKTRFKGKNFNDDEWIRLLIEFPKLMRRPIIEMQYKAAVCDDAARLSEFLESGKG